jgi:hypothetical protein
MLCMKQEIEIKHLEAHFHGVSICFVAYISQGLSFEVIL